VQWCIRRLAVIASAIVVTLGVGNSVSATSKMGTIQDFRSLVTAVDFGPVPTDEAVTTADGSARVVVNGRVTKVLQPFVYAVVWVPGSNWLLYRSRSSWYLTGTSSPYRLSLPGCAGAVGVTTQAVAWWCDGALWVLVVPSRTEGLSLHSARRYVLRVSGVPTRIAVSPSLSLAAVAVNGWVRVYRLSTGQALPGAVAQASAGHLAWSGDVLALAGEQDVIFWLPGTGYAVYPWFGDVQEIVWSENGSGVVLLDRTGTSGGAPVYEVDRLDVNGVLTPLISGRIGYVVGLGPYGTSLWREEGVAAGVWKTGTAGAGRGPFSLEEVRLPGETLPARPALVVTQSLAASSIAAPAQPGMTVLAMAAYAGSPGTFAASLDDQTAQPPQGVLVLTRDYGAHWQPVPLPDLPACDSTHVAPDALAWMGGNLYAGFGSGAVAAWSGTRWAILAEVIDSICKSTGPLAPYVDAFSVDAGGRWAEGIQIPGIEGGGDWIEVGGRGGARVVTESWYAAALWVLPHAYLLIGGPDKVSDGQALPPVAPLPWWESAVGTHWTRLNLPPWLLGANASAAEGVLYGLQATSASGDAVLWSSADGGMHWYAWRALPPGMQWVQAGSGLVMVGGGLATSPVGLISADGGQAWFKVSLPTASQVTHVGRFGSTAWAEVVTNSGTAILTWQLPVMDFRR
jgi:hypothetical protein